MFPIKRHKYWLHRISE